MLKVLTYNIHKGFDTFGRKFVLDNIKKLILESKVDLVFLQEVVGENQAHRSKYSLNFESQLEFLADNVWSYASYGKNAVFPKKHHGNAILSKFPILNQSNHSLTLHRLEQRGFQHCLISPKKNITLHLINTHLNLRQDDRLKQIAMINQYIKVHIPEDSPVILAGDFNDWNSKIDKYIRLNMNLEEAHHSCHNRLALTFPSLLPMTSLDRIYFKNLKPIEAKTIKQDKLNSASDHLPLFVKFK